MLPKVCHYIFSTLVTTFALLEARITAFKPTQTLNLTQWPRLEFDVAATDNKVPGNARYGKQMSVGEQLYSCSDKDPLSQAATERITNPSKQYGDDDRHMEVEQQQEKSDIQRAPLRHTCVDYVQPQKVFQ